MTATETRTLAPGDYLTISGPYGVLLVQIEETSYIPGAVFLNSQPIDGVDLYAETPEKLIERMDEWYGLLRAAAQSPALPGLSAFALEPGADDGDYAECITYYKLVDGQLVEVDLDEEDEDAE